MISIDTAETDKFIDITSAASFDFSYEFGKFEETLLNENNVPPDAPSASDLYLYHLNKIQGYNKTTLNVLNFASILNFAIFAFFFPNFETKYNRAHKHFVLAKFDTAEVQNIFSKKQ